MIADQLKHAALYERVTSRLHGAFAFLRRPDLTTLAEGKYPIDGEDVFALVQQYQTKPLAEGKWEAHRKYIDVQYVVAGVEAMGYAPIESMRPTTEYDPSADFQLFNGEGVDLVISAGMFAVFCPHDVHRQQIAVGVPALVKKVVVKVRVD